MKGMCTIVAVCGLTLGGLAVSTSADTIYEIIGGDEEGFDSNRFDFDILRTAVQAAGLGDDLDSDAVDLTVFAPNDRGFIRTARDLGYDDRDEAGAWEFLVEVLTELDPNDDPIALLTVILQYHVAPEPLDFFDVLWLSIFGEPIETLLEDATIQPFFFKLIDNEPDLRNPRLFFPFNVRASNGIIHTINRVLIPVDLP